MQAFPAISTSDLFSLPGALFFIPRTQLTFSKKLFFCCAKFADSKDTELPNLGGFPANLVVAEKKEAKAVLTLFLKKKGFSKAVAARIVNKSALFIDHLVSRLHSVHQTRDLVGRGLTSLEIRDALNLYLETLYEEFGDILVDVVENFPNPLIEERSNENLSISSAEGGLVVPVPAPITTLNSMQLNTLARFTDYDSTGKPPPHIIYLTELGMEIEVIKEVTRKFPSFPYYCLDGKIKPLVEFLLDLGVPKSDIPTILRKRPQLCGFSLSEYLIPTVKFLENLGVDKKQWPKVIYRFPALLTCSRQKLKSILDCLQELGIPTEKQGKFLTRWPNILGCSVETLRAKAKYFHSIGADVQTLLRKYPILFNLSIETKIKPFIEFLLDLGVPKSNIPTILRKSPQLCGLSLSENLIPTVRFLESLGLDKKQLPKVIYRFPSLLACSRQKLNSNLDYLHELGLPTEKQGKVLTRYPGILGFGVENLRAKAQYFHSIGADVGSILRKCPELFSLSIEANMKPVTQFFLERGFNVEEVGFMVSRFGNLYALSLSNNIIPKWEFFLTMGYPKSDLVKYPHYFGCSLELRIKPRYAILMETGVTMSLNMLLSHSDGELDKVLKRKMEKHAG